MCKIHLEENTIQQKSSMFFLVDRVTNKNILCFNRFERQEMPTEMNYIQNAVWVSYKMLYFDCHKSNVLKGLKSDVHSLPCVFVQSLDHK